MKAPLFRPHQPANAPRPENSAGVAIVLVLEKRTEGRHEHGCFVSSLTAILKHVKIHDVWAHTTGLSGALPGYDVLSVARRHLGASGWRRIFREPKTTRMPDGTIESSPPNWKQDTMPVPAGDGRVDSLSDRKLALRNLTG